MNAAARLVHQNVFTKPYLLANFLTQRQMRTFLLAIIVIISAISMVYVTHTSRILNAQYQRNLQEQNTLQLERSQLLLEKGAWLMQARIEKLAMNKLDMVVPDHHSVVVIKD